MDNKLISTVLAGVLVAGVAANAHAANACDALYQASIKTFQTPHHAYSTTTMRGRAPMTNEAILVGGVEYVQMHGKWTRSPLTPQEMIGEAQDKLKTHPDTCTPIGVQTAGGQAVNAYKVHNSENDTDQQVRILKSGLLQGGIITLPDGTRVETRYEYGNVQAPTGAQ